MARLGKSILWGLWLLRIGLGIFLLLWSLDKIISPEHTVQIFSKHYFLDVSPSLVMITGSLELTLSLMILLGMYKTFSYGLGLLVQMISTAAYYEQLLYPFGVNHFFISELTILFAFISLFIVRNFDTLWTLSKKNNMFSHR